MIYYPLPIIIVSSVTAEDAGASIRALELGAFDVVNKPSGAISVKESVDEIHEKIIKAWQLKDTYLSRRKLVLDKLHPLSVSASKNQLSRVKTTDNIIVIGSSTGGTVALEYIFKALPANLPPVVVVQHMPPGYTRQFAYRLNELSQLTVKESEDGESVQKGVVYISKGGVHLEVERKGSALYLKHRDGEKVQYQKPAVDVLFHSVADTLGKNAAGFLLTGMGKDGAAGLLEMKKAGAFTVAQDEASSIVWGMPRAAIETSAAMEVLSLQKIPQRLVDYAVES